MQRSKQREEEARDEEGRRCPQDVSKALKLSEERAVGTIRSASKVKQNDNDDDEDDESLDDAFADEQGEEERKAKEAAASAAAAVSSRFPVVIGNKEVATKKQRSSLQQG